MIDIFIHIVLGLDPNAEAPSRDADFSGTPEEQESAYVDPADFETRAERAARLIHQTQGRIFGAVVNARSSRRDRTFNAKLSADSFDALDQANGQVRVIEINAAKTGRGRYRTIALERVRSLTIDGVTHDLDLAFGPLPVIAQGEVLEDVLGYRYTVEADAFSFSNLSIRSIRNPERVWHGVPLPSNWKIVR